MPYECDRCNECPCVCEQRLHEKIKYLEEQLKAADELCEEIESNLSWVENGFPDIDAITKIENKIQKYQTLRKASSGKDGSE